MRYAVYSVGECVEAVTCADTVANAVGQSVWRFRDLDHDSFPIVLVLVALRADGSRDRRYREAVFRIDHDLKPRCFARSRLGDLVRRTARYFDM